MLKLMTISVATIALAVTAWMLLPLPGYRAAADTGALYINAVDIDIQPGHIDTFLTSLKADGAAAVKEPGCREFDITVSQKDPNHVFVFEVYDNAAALEAHRAADQTKRHMAAIKDLIVKSDIRAMNSVAMNRKGT